MIEDTKRVKLENFVKEFNEYERLFQDETFIKWKAEVVEKHLQVLRDEVMNSKVIDSVIQGKIYAYQELIGMTDGWFSKMSSTAAEAHKILKR